MGGIGLVLPIWGVIMGSGTPREKARPRSVRTRDRGPGAASESLASGQGSTLPGPAGVEDPPTNAGVGGIRDAVGVRRRLSLVTASGEKP